MSKRVKIRFFKLIKGLLIYSIKVKRLFFFSKVDKKSNSTIVFNTLLIKVVEI